MKEIQSFLGLANCYRKYMRSYFAISKPLKERIKNALLVWNPSAKKSFNTLKESLASSPVLTPFDPHVKVLVTTNASVYAVGAFLE